MNNTTVHQQIQGHPASVDAYIRHGWKLTPIPPGTKAPLHDDWNSPDKALLSAQALPHNYGIGLCHAYSGTMALDVDHWDRAKEELLKHGIDLDALYTAPDAVTIESGKPGHGKLLYRMPMGMPLPSKKLIDKDAEGKRYNYLDFRCGTSSGKTAQDVLPPTIHPETMQPYRWGGSTNWNKLPLIPDALLAFWTNLLNESNNFDQEYIENARPINWDELQEALNHLDPNMSRDEWVSVGMSLYWAGLQTNEHERAFTMWNDWSAKATGNNWEGRPKYQGDKDLYNVWRSFKSNGQIITTATLYNMAIDAGFRPKIDASELFKPATEEQPVIDFVEPDNVIESMYPQPPDINFDYVPKPLADAAKAVSLRVGCDPLVPLMSGIGAICGVVDAQSRLELLPGFRVPPVLWLMTIGDPAAKKSPGSRPMFRTLKEIEKEDLPRYKAELLMWEGQEAHYSAAKKSFLEYASSPEAMLSNDSVPGVPELPPAPVPVKITVSDITSQKLVRHTEQRPRGLLCYLDEMNSWIRKMIDNRSGEDRSAWVMAFESERYEMDRVGAGTISADNFAVSVYGNVQPRVFRENINRLSDDGFIQRFIPAALRSSKRWEYQPMMDTSLAEMTWEATLRTIYAIHHQTFQLSPEARNEFRAFQQWYEEMKHDEMLLKTGDVYMTAFGKLEGMVGRITLIWHLINEPFNPTVSISTIKQAIGFVKNYVIPSIKYTYGDVGGLVKESFDVWVAEHIAHHCDKEVITLSEIKHSARRQLEKANVRNNYDANEMIRMAMVNLEQSNWVHLQDHPRNPTWYINPLVKDKFSEQRTAIIKAKQRQYDYRYKTVKKAGGSTERRIVKGYDPETMDDKIIGE